eukprot:351073-Chlamydomonas_euryale.AAC.2
MHLLCPPAPTCTNLPQLAHLPQQHPLNCPALPVPPWPARQHAPPHEMNKLTLETVSEASMWGALAGARGLAAWRVVSPPGISEPRACDAAPCGGAGAEAQPRRLALMSSTQSGASAVLHFKELDTSGKVWGVVWTGVRGEGGGSRPARSWARLAKCGELCGSAWEERGGGSAPARNIKTGQDLPATAQYGQSLSIPTLLPPQPPIPLPPQPSAPLPPASDADSTTTTISTTTTTTIPSTTSVSSPPAQQCGFVANKARAGVAAADGGLNAAHAELMRRTSGQRLFGYRELLCGGAGWCGGRQAPPARSCAGGCVRAAPASGAGAHVHACRTQIQRLASTRVCPLLLPTL